MLSAAAHVTNSGTSNLTIALIALTGVLFGALLGFVGKSRELRLARQGELRRLYADFLAARDSFDLIEHEAESAKSRLSEFSNGMEVEDQDEYDALPESTKTHWRSLSSEHMEKQRALRMERRRFWQALRQIEIQAPSDTHYAAWVYSGLSDAKLKYEAEALAMLVGLARRDLASLTRAFGLKRQMKRSKQAQWWVASCKS